MQRYHSVPSITSPSESRAALTACGYQETSEAVLQLKPVTFRYREKLNPDRDSLKRLTQNARSAPGLRLLDEDRHVRRV